VAGIAAFIEEPRVYHFVKQRIAQRFGRRLFEMLGREFDQQRTFAVRDPSGRIRKARIIADAAHRDFAFEIKVVEFGEEQLEIGFRGQHEEFILRASKRLFVTTGPQRGLPPRIYLPITAVFAAVFIGLIVLMLRQSLNTGGSVFGSGASAQATQAPPQLSVQGGGPPAGVRMQLQQLEARVARNPKDDVALTQLGDMYLAAGKGAQAIPYYRRALAANKNNVAAQEGLQQAQAENQ
jgi:hypothetical protein